jgi:hypothetical protein
MPSSAHSPDELSRALVNRVASGGLLAAALYSAMELGVADMLADGPRSTQDLAIATHADEDALYRVLRALASIGIFSEEAPRTFALTRPAQLLRSHNAVMTSQLRWMAHPTQLHAASQLLDVVRVGRTSQRGTAAAGFFESLAGDPGLLDCFQRAMTAHTREVIDAVLEAYDFSDVPVIVDVGGGTGELLLRILALYPNSRGILFDRAEVVIAAGEYLAASPLRERCTAQAGDFLRSVPSGGDAYVLKHVLHDWDDDGALLILRHVSRELAARPAKVLVLETPLSAGNRPDNAKIGDLAMLLTVGGRERTLSEYQGLFEASNLRLHRAVSTAVGLTVLEAVLAQGGVP